VKPLFLTLLLLTILNSPSLAASPALSNGMQITGILGQVEGRLVAQRDIYWHQGDYPRIIALDRIITAADPHFLDAYETGGWLLDSLGDRKDAQAYYRLGVANNPRVEPPYFGLAFFYFSTLHDYPLAASIFREGARLPGADINDWKMTAHSQEHAHEYVQAVATWQYIKKRWPHGLAVNQNLKRALAMQQAAQTRETAP
jgi:tetratricopeptide (TPR) repeat protein